MSNPRYANGSARRKLRARLRQMYDHCPKCGKRLDWEHPYLPNSAELDEYIPVSKIPDRYKRQACLDPDNVGVLCRECNKLKGDKLPWQMKLERRPPERVETSQSW